MRAAAVAAVIGAGRFAVGNQAVVDEQFLAGIDLDEGFEAQHHAAGFVVVLDRLAVRRARMIQVACGIAALGAVDGFVVRQLEKISQAVVPSLGRYLRGGVAAAFIEAEERTCRERPRRIGTEAVHAAGGHAQVRRGGRNGRG